MAPLTRLAPTLRRGGLAALTMTLLAAGPALAACGSGALPGAAAGTAGSTVLSPATPPPPVTTLSTPPPPPPPAAIGKAARGQRVWFRPTTITLPGGLVTQVDVASTVDGQLAVPTDVAHVGWWDGGAQAGEPFGSMVIAGHVDSTGGLGFFARLLAMKVGDDVTVSDGRHQLTYRVASVVEVKKGVLATGTSAFAQTGDHRLTLITCAGAYDRNGGGYEENLVVTATPTGPVTATAS